MTIEKLFPWLIGGIALVFVIQAINGSAWAGTTTATSNAAQGALGGVLGGLGNVSGSSAVTIPGLL